jgi:CBS domain containing-hemolysin-like protein
MPDKGEEVHSEGYAFFVNDISKTRILKVKITRELSGESEDE